jgi:hypothetical protein
MVRMRCDRCYDGKVLNMSERFLADGSDLRIFCYIFVYSAGGKIQESPDKLLI